MNEEIMKACGFGEQVQRMKDGRCAWCGVPINRTHFRDDLSLREWRISGMCQHCQDAAFAATEEPELEYGRPDDPPGGPEDDPRFLR